MDDLPLIDADFRRYYHWPPDFGPGIADEHFPEEMSAETFFRLAEALLFQQDSAVRGAAEYEHNRKQQQQDQGQSGHPTPGRIPATGQEAPPRNLDQLAMSDGFRGDGQGMPPAIGRMKKRT